MNDETKTQPAQAAQVDRARETPRRQQAVEMLLELGWTYNSERGWEEPATTAEPVAQGEADQTTPFNEWWDDFRSGHAVNGTMKGLAIAAWQASKTFHTTHSHSPDAADSGRADELLAYLDSQAQHPTDQFGNGANKPNPTLKAWYAKQAAIVRALAAQGQGEAVAEVYEYPRDHREPILTMLTGIRFTGMPLPIGAKLYAHPHSPDAADSGRVSEAMVEQACIAASDQYDDGTSWDSTSEKEKGYARNRMRRAITTALAAQGHGEAARPMLKRDGVQIDLTAHCPFCGCEDELRHAPNDYATDGGQMGQPNVDPFFVHCDGCGCDGPVGESEQDALNLWNNRDRTAPAGEAGGVPDGMVLVPCEPTEAMYEQMYEVKMYVAFDRFRRDWSRMLAAALTEKGNG